MINCQTQQNVMPNTLDPQYYQSTINVPLHIVLTCFKTICNGVKCNVK